MTSRVITVPDWINAEFHWSTPKEPEPQPHRHDWHELILVRQGRYGVRIGTQDLQLKAEESIYYPPGLKHRPAGQSSYRNQLYVLMWRGGDNAGLPGAPVKLRDHRGRLASLLAWIWELRLARHPDRMPAAQGLWVAVREEIKRLVSEPVPRSRPDPVDVVQEAMQGLAGLPLTRAELAARVGWNTSQLARRFQQQTGLPPMRYLQQVRLHRAARLLVTTDLPLKTIAQRSGLGSAAYLCRLFRRSHGQTPLHYRRAKAART
jgi:AraC-like DNA-binding protein